MVDSIRNVPRRARGSGRYVKGLRPPDVDDKEIVEAILTEVQWEEEGMPDVSLDGWWSNRWESPGQ